MAIIRKAKADEQEKRCRGSVDTLEFSQAVSGSEPCECKPDGCGNKSGGGMRAIKYKTLTKKNRKLRKRSHRKKKKGNASYKFYYNKSKRKSYRRSRKNKK